MTAQAAFYKGKGTIELGATAAIDPAAHEVQIQVAYGGICGTDIHIFHGAMSHRVSIPQVMGHEISGVVSAIGEAVSNVNVGDRVTVMPLEPRDCSDSQQASDAWYVCEGLKVLGLDTNGGFQSYWNVPAHTIHILPDSLSLQHGALIEPLAVACHAVRRGSIVDGEQVVVLGGGPIGTLVALVARYVGANVVIAELNPYRIDLLRDQLGFEVINPSNEDLTSVVMQQTSDRGCDAVFEVTGNAKAAEVMTALPRIHGRIMVTGIFTSPPPVDLFKIFWREISIIPTRLYNYDDFTQAIEIAASGDIALQSIITDIRPLRELQKCMTEISQGADTLKTLIDVKGVSDETS